MKKDDKVIIFALVAAVLIGLLLGWGITSQVMGDHIEETMQYMAENERQISSELEGLESAYALLEFDHAYLKNHASQLEANLTKLIAYLESAGYEVTPIWTTIPYLERTLEIADIVARLEAIERLLGLEK